MTGDGRFAVVLFGLSAIWIGLGSAAYGDLEDDDLNRRVQREDEQIMENEPLEQPKETGYNSYHGLHLHIMQAYNRHVRPLAGTGDEILVNFSMVLTHMDSVNEDHQTVDLHGWVIMSWYDERLAWNSSAEYNPIPKIVVPQHFIWKPDLHLYNNAESKVDTLVSSNTLAHLYSDGRVVIDPPFSLRAYCEFDYRRYPWDKQTCTVALGSWAYRTHELKWRLSSSIADDPHLLYRDSHRAYDTNWKITNVSLLLSELIFESEKWHYVNILFTLDRRSTYAKQFILIPVLVTMMLTALAFLFTVTRKGIWKLLIMLTALILEIVHLLALYSRLPSMVFNGVPGVVILCIINVFITLISLLIASLTTSLAERTTSVPAQLMDILRSKLVGLFFCFSPDQLESQYNMSPSTSVRSKRQQNHRHAILITNQMGVTKRIQPPYADEPDYPSRPPSRPGSPNDSFRVPVQPSVSQENGRRRGYSGGERTENLNPWLCVAVVLDRMMFLILGFIYAVLWVALVAA